MDYLNQMAALTACSAIKESIEKINKSIETQGKLCSDKSDLHDSAKSYFLDGINRNKEITRQLLRLAADLSNQSWRAFKAEKE